MFQKKLDQQISLFTLLTYFYAGNTDGDKKHSWKFEVGPVSRKLTHGYSYKRLRSLVEEGDFKGRFSRAIIYENITDKQIYTNAKGVILHLPDVVFRYDDKKNHWLDTIEYYDMEKQTRRVIAFTEDQMKAHATKNWIVRKKLLERNTFRQAVKEAVQ